MTNKLYEIYGFKNKERTLPCYACFTDRNKAQKHASKLIKQGLYQKTEVTTHSERILFRGWQ